MHRTLWFRLQQVKISPNTAALDRQTKEKKNLFTLGMPQVRREIPMPPRSTLK